MPLISLATPVYNTKESWLRECLDSVLKQTFQDWELCLCNNGSDSYIYRILEEYQHLDSRIKVNYLLTNKGGYKGLQKALELCTGKYVGLLDSDDTIPVYALEEIGHRLYFNPPDVLYTNEMVCDENNTPVVPFLKPDYDKDLLCFLHYFGHLTLYAAPVIRRLGLKHTGGSYDYDLALRASELNKIDIVHLNAILYNYRTYSYSTSATTRESCIRGALETLQEHLDLEMPGAVAMQNGSLYKVTLGSGEVLKPNLLDISDSDHLIKRLFNELS